MGGASLGSEEYNSDWSRYQQGWGDNFYKMGGMWNSNMWGGNKMMNSQGRMSPLGFRVAPDKVHTAAVCHTMAPEARWGPIPVRPVHTTALAEAPEWVSECRVPPGLSRSTGRNSLF